MKPIKIFLVEDDTTFVFLAKKTIQSTKIDTNIRVFGDGQETIDYLKQIANHTELLPDIMLVDINMPVMDGWEFLNEYNLFRPKLKKDIALYLVSSSISPFDIERAKSNNVVSDFLIKPLLKGKFLELFKDCKKI